MQELIDTMRLGQILLAGVLIMLVSWFTYHNVITARSWSCRKAVKALLGVSALCFLIGQIVATWGLFGTSISPRMFFLIAGSIIAIPSLLWFIKMPEDESRSLETLYNLKEQFGNIQLSEAIEKIESVIEKERAEIS